MSVRAFLALCAQALFIQIASSQCLGHTGFAAGDYGWGYNGLAYNGLANYRFASPYGLAGRGCSTIVETIPTSGGGLIVTSGSAIPPVGLTVSSENVYEGNLAAAGELPFVGTVGVDTILPTAGTGAINYGCGNGVTDMTASDFIAPGAPAPKFGAFGPAAIAPAATIASPIGYQTAWAGHGQPHGCDVF